MKKLLSLISEKDGKLSAKRVAGLVCTIFFIEVIQFAIFKKTKFANIELLLKIEEHLFIIIMTALVGVSATGLFGYIKNSVIKPPEDVNS